jgi:hypothetical protein
MYKLAVIGALAVVGFIGLHQEISGVGTQIASHLRPAQFDVDTSRDWIQELLRAADQIGMPYSDDCVKELRDWAATHSFARGAAVMGRGFLLRDGYRQDFWLCEEQR